MFNNCTSLTSLNISSFKTTNAKSMSFMFSNCSSLANISVKIDTSSITTMQSMFESCTNLRYVDLSSFNTNKCNKFTNMFANTTNLTVAVKQSYCINMIREIEDYVKIEYIN